MVRKPKAVNRQAGSFHYTKRPVQTYNIPAALAIPALRTKAENFAGKYVNTLESINLDVVV